jgi:NAD(P)-dependent dehydrogenase (short-subunit alcohol dehydrogenase family)
VTKVWFITGASRGLGRHFVKAALARGDKVAATARSAGTLSELSEAYGDLVLPITLDVTDRAGVISAVAQAFQHFGRLDVVVNNAGYGLFGTVEEISEAEFRAQLETNVFGTLWVTQAVLPVLREQGSGHIIQISSFNGVASFPMMGAYSASKFAVEALSDALAQEVAGFGIKVTLVEPGPYGTEWGTTSAAHATPNKVYDGVRTAFYDALKNILVGDPEATGPALLKIVDAENPPTRVFFGSYPLQMVQALYEARIEEWRKWGDLSVAATGVARPMTHSSSARLFPGQPRRIRYACNQRCRRPGGTREE